MATMNISLPETMKEYVEKRVDEDGFSTVSAFIQQLVREDQKQKEQEKLEALLLERLQSGKPITVTPEYWEKKKAALTAKYGK